MMLVDLERAGRDVVVVKCLNGYFGQIEPERFEVRLGRFGIRERRITAQPPLAGPRKLLADLDALTEPVRPSRR